MLLAAAAAAPALPAGAAEPFVFPVYTSAAQVDAACEAMLAELKQQAARLQALPDADAGSVLAGIDAMTIRADDVTGPMDLLSSVHPDKAIRDAANACTLNYQGFNAAFLQNARIYALVKDLKPKDDIDRRDQRDLLDAFEDSGVALPPDTQQRAQQLTTQMTALAQGFDRRVNEDTTRVAYRAWELAGVPMAVWRGAPRDAAGRYLLGLDHPTSDPIVDQADLPAARERMWRAFYTRGGTENMKALGDLIAQRREYAQLLGFSSYDDFVLRRHMAGSEEAVRNFLDLVRAAIGPRELSDIEVLREAKARHLGRSARGLPLRRWDVQYYSERARRSRYAVEQPEFRPYFPPEESLQFVFRIARRLFGIEFKPQTQTLWHPEARAYSVVDAETQQPIGSFYADLYPRADKYSHAATWPVRAGSTLAGRSPAAALVVNFDRQGLTLDELETLLHEFGHSLHVLLSQTRYAGQAGTNVQIDFVEAPSQMLEDWVYDAHVLALFQEVCPRCRPVPPALLDKARRARYFGNGILYARQRLYASYDLALHGQRADDPLELWARMEGATPLGYVAGTMLPASFTHLADGYGAGYYGYLWSQVIAYDLRTAFEGHRLDPAVGARYRATVLANGGQVAPAELIARFLGRPLSEKAFYDELKKQ